MGTSDHRKYGIGQQLFGKGDRRHDGWFVIEVRVYQTISDDIRPNMRRSDCTVKHCNALALALRGALQHTDSLTDLFNGSLFLSLSLAHPAFPPEVRAEAEPGAPQVGLYILHGLY